MRLKRLCWHGSPHHPIHSFMCNCTFFFPPFPAFDACVKVFCSCGKSMRPLKHNFLFLLLFILSGSLCVGEKTMTQGLFCFFSLALEFFWYYLHDGKVYVCLWVSWMARVIVQVRKKNTGQHRTWLYPVAGDDKVTSSVINVKSCNNSKHTNVITLANDTFKKTKPENDFTVENLQWL